MFSSERRDHGAMDADVGMVGSRRREEKNFLLSRLLVYLWREDWSYSSDIW
jgi:hypothetical protein